MSDLQCPATIVLIPSASLGSSACNRALEGHRLSGLFVAEQAPPAAISNLAAANDLTIERVQTGSDRKGFRQALEGLADAYRGEAIALVASGEALQLGLGLDAVLEEPVVLSVDSSGWTIVPRR